MLDPSVKGFDCEVEEEGEHGVALEGAPLDRNRWGGAMGGEEDSGS